MGRNLVVVLIHLVAMVAASAIATPVGRVGTRHDRPALHALRGGAADGQITVRVRARTGTVRVTLSSGESLSELQRRLQKAEKGLAVGRQRLSLAPNGAQPLDAEADGEKSLEALGIKHGAMLHCDMAPDPTAKSASDDAADTAESDTAEPAAAEPAAAASTRTRPAGAAQGRRQRGTTMADYVDQQAANEIVLETPAASACEFVSVEPSASKSFVDFALERAFEERRVALLYGRFVDPPPASGQKRGVLVDVVYEPAQQCDASTMALEQSDAALAERKRADRVASELGLTLVGVAFTHPPRHHTLEPLELAYLAEQQRAAEGADARAGELFVGVLFRAVYEGEAIDGDVTAEVYQPTKQATDLICDGKLVPASAGGARLVPSDAMAFKIGPKVEPTVDLSYFVTRIRDLARPYEPPACGVFRQAFPIANRGAELRKFHVRTFLQKQRDAGVDFAAAVLDFGLLLHAASVLPEPVLTRLCTALGEGKSKAGKKAREEEAAAIQAAQSSLCEYAGLAPA